MPGFSTTNIIFYFVLLSFKRMQPGFTSNSMFFLFMFFSTMEPAVKEEMDICIYIYR